MSGLDIASRLLAGIGAVNWGLVSLAEFDLVAAVFGLDFGQTNALTRIVYGLVGVAGLLIIVRLFPGVRSAAGRSPPAGPARDPWKPSCFAPKRTSRPVGGRDMPGPADAGQRDLLRYCRNRDRERAMEVRILSWKPSRVVPPLC